MPVFSAACCGLYTDLVEWSPGDCRTMNGAITIGGAVHY